MISTVIPTYKEPEALDLCLKSAISGQHYKNQLIVVVDGFYDLNKSVLDKYKNSIEILNLEENVGMIRAMNYGHFNSSFDLVFHVQDDNVFPKDWDLKLMKSYQKNSVLTPNQIEPSPSIFSQFHIYNFGKDPNLFDLQTFWEYSTNISVDKVEESGSTFPFLINKYDYLKIGGFDESYPGPWVVDWEFFMKCKMNGMKMLRTYSAHFYHFVSLGTRTSEKIKHNAQLEQECFHFFKYKWGKYPSINQYNNEKTL